MSIVLPDCAPTGPGDREILAAYREALLACSANQSYVVAGRTFTRANLPEIRNTIVWLEQRIAAASGVGDGSGFVRASFKWD